MRSTALPPSLSRRAFLELTGAAACALATGSVLGGCAALPSLTAEPTGDRISLDRARVDASIGDGPGLYLRVPGLAHDLILLRPSGSSAGELAGADYAVVSALCTHLGCRLRPAGDSLVCPCHGSTFARDGAVMRGPAQSPLPVYPVAALDGRLDILLSTRPR